MDDVTDEAVAREVMGTATAEVQSVMPDGSVALVTVLVDKRWIPKYTTDPCAAMQVIERMEALGWSWDCGRQHGEEAEMTFWRYRPKRFVDGRSEASPLPLAVARAALAAVRADKGGE